MKSWLMLKLYRTTANWSILHKLFRLIYLYTLLPILAFIVKSKFSYVTQIIPRNSLIEKNRFNVFFSDIDLTIVILDNQETKKIFKFFFKAKYFLPMLDNPEIYYESEYKELVNIQKSSFAPIIDTFWHIRKINWNFQKLESSLSLFEKEKINRSIKHSLLKISSSYYFPTSEIYFSKINYISSLISSNETPNICFFSLFLETNSTHSLKIILNSEEFDFLDYLMPDRPIKSTHRELKRAILRHELLLTIASIRIDEAFENSSIEKKDWVKFLKNQND